MSPSVTAQPYVPLPATTPLPPQIIAGVPDGSPEPDPAPPQQPDVSGGPLHYGHYGPDGQGWPPTELPPGYRPMAQPELPTAYPPVQQFTGYGTQPADYGTPPQHDDYDEYDDGYQEPTRTYPAGTYGSPAVPPEQRYEARTPLFDQQPPPDFDWGPSPFPAQRSPSEALTPPQVNYPHADDSRARDPHTGEPHAGVPQLDDPLTGPLPEEPDEYDPYGFQPRALPAAGSWSDSAFPEEPAAFPDEPAGYPAEPVGYQAEPVGYQAEPDVLPAEPVAFTEPAVFPAQPAVFTEPASYPAEPVVFSAERVAETTGEVHRPARAMPGSTGAFPMVGRTDGVGSEVTPYAAAEALHQGEVLPRVEEPDDPADVPVSGGFGAQLGSPGGPARDALGAPVYGVARDASGGVYGAQMGSPGGPARDALGAPMYGAAGEISGGGPWNDGSALPASGGLPQRTPKDPDVPSVPDVSAVLPANVDAQPAVAKDLRRIATFLRHDEVGEPHPPEERPDGFDVGAVVAAVSGVEGVRDAKLVAKPDGGHTLRLELTDTADPGWVSRVVARLLNDQMGIAAEPDPATPPAPPIPEKRRSPAREITGVPQSPAPGFTNGAPTGGVPRGETQSTAAQSAAAQNAAAQDAAAQSVAVQSAAAQTAGAQIAAAQSAAAQSAAAQSAAAQSAAVQGAGVWSAAPSNAAVSGAGVDSAAISGAGVQGAGVRTAAAPSAEAAGGAEPSPRPGAADDIDPGTSDGYAVGSGSGARSGGAGGRVLHSVPAGAEVPESDEPDGFDGSGSSASRELRHRRPASGGRRTGDVGRPASGIPLLGAVPTTPPDTVDAPAAESGAADPEDEAATTPIERPGKALVRTGVVSSPRVVIDHVEVSTQGLDAVVEVHLLADGNPAVGVASGPNVDGYSLRVAASAAAAAIDELLLDEQGVPRARSYVEHAAVVSLGNCDVTVVVVLLTCDGWVDQLTGSAKVDGDPRQSVVRATLDAVNRRLEALLP